MVSRSNVVVAGAGFAGLVYAIQMKKHHPKMDVTIISPSPTDEGSNNALTTALMHPSIFGQFKELLGDELFDKYVANIIGEGPKVTIGYEGVITRVDFLEGQYFSSDPNLKIIEILRAKALELGIGIVNGECLKRQYSAQTGSSIQYRNLSDDKTLDIEADLFIIATGANPSLLSKLGFDTMSSVVHKNNLKYVWQNINPLDELSVEAAKVIEKKLPFIFKSGDLQIGCSRTVEGQVSVFAVLEKDDKRGLKEVLETVCKMDPFGMPPGFKEVINQIIDGLDDKDHISKKTNDVFNLGETPRTGNNFRNIIAGAGKLASLVKFRAGRATLSPEDSQSHKPFQLKAAVSSLSSPFLGAATKAKLVGLKSLNSSIAKRVLGAPIMKSLGVPHLANLIKKSLETVPNFEKVTLNSVERMLKNIGVGNGDPVHQKFTSLFKSLSGAVVSSMKHDSSRTR